MLRTSLILASLVVFTNCLAQQDTARVMCFNLLNFPTFNLEGREDTLRKILNYTTPDILLVQELKTDSGLNLIADVSFADFESDYDATEFIPQQSNPLGGFKLQQAMIYNSDKFGLINEGYLVTGTRDINKFLMYYKGEYLNSSADTIFFYVFVTHFKASQGTTNEQRRLEMAQTFGSHQQWLTPNTPVIFAGDLNLYNSD